MIQHNDTNAGPVHNVPDLSTLSRIVPRRAYMPVCTCMYIRIYVCTVLPQLSRAVAGLKVNGLFP